MYGLDQNTSMHWLFLAPGMVPRVVTSEVPCWLLGWMLFPNFTSWVTLLAHLEWGKSMPSSIESMWCDKQVSYVSSHMTSWSCEAPGLLGSRNDRKSNLLYLKGNKHPQWSRTLFRTLLLLPPVLHNDFTSCDAVPKTSLQHSNHFVVAVVWTLDFFFWFTLLHGALLRHRTGNLVTGVLFLHPSLDCC